MRSLVACAAVAVGAAAGMTLIGAPRAAAAETAAEIGADAIVSEIQISGLQRIEPETVLAYLRIEVGDAAGSGTINAGLRRLFASGLFQDARITPLAGGVLDVTVVENPIINQISFEGNRAVGDEILQAQIQSRPRASLTRARAEADAQSVLDVYRGAGRFATSVEPVIIERDGNRVDLIFEISEGQAVGVAAIKFVGNTEYSDRRLRGAIETSESAWWRLLAVNDNYNPDRLEYDRELLRRYYFRRGYADFEVLSAIAELNPERTGFFITFTVSEGERYRVGEVSVVAEAPGVDAADFERYVLMSSGDTYDAELVERTVSDMRARAGRDAINFVDVRADAKKRRDEDGAPFIDLVYRIVEAPRIYVERIEIIGNSRTLDRVIRREFLISEGDAFDAYRLERGEQQVRALGFFSNVETEVEAGSAEDRAVIRTTVEEQSTGELSFGLGYSTGSGFGGQVTVSERNFLGRGQYVRASVSLSRDRRFYDFRFTEPYFLGRQLRAGFDLYHLTENNQRTSSYNALRTGLRPRIGFRIDENSRIDFSYLIQKDQVSATTRVTSPLIEQDRGGRLISSIGYDYTLDHRNDPNQPTRGFILTLGQDFAGLGGDSRHIRTEASVQGYTSFFREEVVAKLELAGGAVFGFNGKRDVLIEDRFMLGGEDFRGFASGGVGPRDMNIIGRDSDGDGLADDNVTLKSALGGNYYMMARAELSFPIGLPEEYGVYGGLFADAGTLWGLDDTTYRTFKAQAGNVRDDYTVDDSMKFRAATGASLFWTSPFGPLRFNLAYPLLSQKGDDKEIFSFSAGTRF